MTRLYNLLHRLGRDQGGVIAVIFALMFPVLAGILGLGVEASAWYTVKRHDQSIADLIAYSGALELVAGGSCATGWASCLAAKNDAIANNFDPTASANSGSTVTVDPNGACGSSTCKTVTVTLKHNQTPMLLGFLTDSNTPFAIAEHAVAQVQADTIDSCVGGGVGSDTGTSLLVKGGAPLVTLTDCTITSGSTDAKSIDLRGSAAGDITAAAIYTAGGTNPACTKANFTNVTTLNCNATVPPVNPYASVTPPTMPTMPSLVTTFPTLATALSTPAAQAVNNKVTAPASQTGTGCTGTTTFTSAQGCYTTSSLITISGTSFTAGKVYSFAGPVSIGAGVTIGANAQISLNSPGNLTFTGGATFSQVLNKNNPTKIFVSNGSITSSGAVTFTGGGPSGSYFALTASGGVSFGGNTSFGQADYGFYGGNLALNGCTVFTSGATTLQVPNGNLTTGSGGVYFNTNAAHCGVAAQNGASTYALQVQSGGSYSIGGASTDVASFGPASYGFTNGSVTINGTATFPSGTTNVNIASGNLITAAASTLTFTGGGGSNYALATKAGGAYTIGGTATFGTGSPTANYAFYNGGVTIKASQNANFAPANYYVDSGSLTVNGCAAFQAGSATINLKAGSLTSSGVGSTVAFSPTGNVCGVSQPSGASTYYIKPGGGNVTLAGSTTTFGAGNYYFYTGNVTLSSTAVTLGAGIYSLQTGSFSIAAGAKATVAADTTATYIYEPSGTFSNAGQTTFAAGTMYFYDGSGGFTSTGSALTFTGGNNSAGTASTYYFYNGGTNGALNIAANASAAFGPANYYIVKGNLVIGSGATLSCPSCAAAGTAGAGDTFVLTLPAAGVASDIGTVQIAAAIKGTLTAPGASCSFSTPGCYQGLLIFQDPNATLGTTNNGGQCQTNCNTLDIGDSVNMTGALYLPKAVVDFTGGHASANCLVLIDQETTFQSNISLTTTGCTAAGVATQTTTVQKAVLTQ